MRRYEEPVEVRRGPVRGPGAHADREHEVEGPEQFLWRGRVWKVRAVIARWVETGSWWQSESVSAVIGAGEATGRAESDAGPVSAAALLSERELWRVEAGASAATGAGVFDLSFDTSDGCWQLVGCQD